MAEQNRTTNIVIGMVTAETSPDPSRLINELLAGMDAYFPQYSWTLAHAVSQSPSRKPSLPAPCTNAHNLTYEWHGMPAKTNGYRAILEFSQRRQASACLIVDPSQRGFHRTWVDSLIRPGIHSGYDLVTPVYSGCARESLLSGNLLAPMLQALFGCGPRQPMASEFLLSGKLIDRLLTRRDWESTPARHTPELWMSVVACAERYRMAESAVGPSDRHTGRSSLHRQAAVAQVVNSLFSLMEQYQNRWASPAVSAELDQFGQATPDAIAPANRDGLEYLVAFVDAFPALAASWQTILTPQTFRAVDTLQAALRRGETGHSLTDAVWVRVVFEIAAAWKRRVLPRGQVLGLFTPLLLARAGSFAMKTQWSEQSEVEAELHRLAGFFRALLPVLQRLWNGGAGAQGVEAA